MTVVRESTTALTLRDLIFLLCTTTGEPTIRGMPGRNHRVRLSNLANLDNFGSLLLLGIAWRVVQGFWLPEFYIT